VLSKLLSSVDRGDPKLVPLISSLQASLRAKVDTPNLTRQAAPRLAKTKPQSTSTSSATSTDLTPSTPGSAGSNRDWTTRNPFSKSLPRQRGQQQSFYSSDHGASGCACEPLQTPGQNEKKVVKDRSAVPLSEFSFDGVADENQHGGANVDGGSKIPWKIRAARRRAAKPHTTGMTKDEFAEIKQSLQESASKREQRAQEHLRKGDVFRPPQLPKLHL